MYSRGNTEGQGDYGLNGSRKGPHSPFPRDALKMHAGGESSGKSTELGKYDFARLECKRRSGLKGTPVNKASLRIGKVITPSMVYKGHFLKFKSPLTSSLHGQDLDNIHCELQSRKVSRI